MSVRAAVARAQTERKRHEEVSDRRCCWLPRWIGRRRLQRRRSRAETGQVAVVFTKGGFIVGVGGGEGVLVFRGKRYPFTVSGMSVGFTIGASTTKFVGRASICRGPVDLTAAMRASGAGGAVAAGAGGVQLQNGNGVILQLSGPKVGAEAVGGSGRRHDHD